MNTNSNSSALSSLDSKLTHSETRINRALTFKEPLNQVNQANLLTQEQKKSIALIYIEQAQVYSQEHNWRKAIIACKNALEISPDTADAYKILGDILYRQGKEGEALGIYAKALTINPNLATVYANVGALYADREDWQKALDYYQQAVILDPYLAEAYRNLAQVWEELDDTEKALECFCRAVDLDPKILDAEDYFNFGQELYRQGKLKEASILFIHGVRLNPSAEEELAQLVKILEELEEWQKAVVYYHQLMSLPELKKDSEVNQSEVSAHQRKSSEHKPIRNLLSASKSSAIKVTAKDTKNNIPVIAQDVAQRLLPKVRSKPYALKHSRTLNEPEHQSIRVVSGISLGEREVKGSTTVDTSTLDIAKNSPSEPDSALSWNNLGSLYAQKKQWEKAVSCYQEALQLDADFAKSYRNLARVYNHKGEQLKAALYWHEAFCIEPDIVSPEEYYSLAQKLLQHNQKEKAIACLQRTIELSPNFPQALVTLNKLEEN